MWSGIGFYHRLEAVKLELSWFCIVLFIQQFISNEILLWMIDQLIREIIGDCYALAIDCYAFYIDYYVISKI